jgi:hypothetical protein
MFVVRKEEQNLGTLSSTTEVCFSGRLLFGALVDALGRAELYGIIDHSIDRLVCTSQISILEASTPNLLIVQDPLTSLLRAPIGSV